MAILIEKNTTVLVQGITGREGSARAAFMKGYGTKVVAGVTPGRGRRSFRDPCLQYGRRGCEGERSY